MVNSLLMMKKNIYSFINNLIILLNAKNAQYWDVFFVYIGLEW